MLNKIDKLTLNKSKSHKSKQDHYNEIVKIALENGGECLDKEYLASNLKMKFKCIDNHEWEARPNDIKRGTWCPSCRSNKTENLVRQFFETVFDQPFKAASPDWLIITGERKMIIDGYNKSLKIAFEYHGIQHYQYTPHFHDKQNKSLKEQQIRDERVRTLAVQNKVKLVEIKYITDGYTKEDFVNYMKSVIEDNLGVEVTAQHLDKFNELPFASSKLNELRAIAKSMKGECLSTKYIGTHSKVKWRCQEGHEWESVAKSVKKGHWCPYCNGHLRAGNLMDDINAVIEPLGGVCLSKDAKTLRDKLEFTCVHNHKFTKTGESIVYRQSWCPYCAKNKVINPLEKVRQHAESKGGLCLSGEYVNSRAKLEFQCAHQHTWETSYCSIINSKSWCPVCNNLKKGDNLGAFKKVKNNKNRLFFYV